MEVSRLLKVLAGTVSVAVLVTLACLLDLRPHSASKFWVGRPGKDRVLSRAVDTLGGRGREALRDSEIKDAAVESLEAKDIQSGKSYPRKQTHEKQLQAKKYDCIRRTFENGTSGLELSVFSQTGEDGVIGSIYECIGEESKYFVEFGVEDGSQCTTRYLRERKGWNGLSMDGSYSNYSINLQREFFTAGNIVGIFQKHEVPFHFDHLTIDIDQNTFWVLQAILAGGYRPRTIVSEINGNFHPLDAFVVHYESTRMWDTTMHYGASAGALDMLLSAFGYHVIAIDQLQINVYAVHSSEVGSKRPLSMRTVAGGLSKATACGIHPGKTAHWLQVSPELPFDRPRCEWYESLPVWLLKAHDLHGAESLGACVRLPWTPVRVFSGGPALELYRNATKSAKLMHELPQNIRLTSTRLTVAEVNAAMDTYAR